MFIKVSMARCSRLVIFSSRKSSVFRHASTSRLRDAFIVWSVSTLSRKWYLRYLTQTVHSNSKLLSSWQKNCLSKIPWCAPHILLFLISSRKSCVFRHTFPSRLLGPCSDLVSRRCYVSVVMFAPWRWDCWSMYPRFYLTKKKVNFWFNGKILSLLINIESVNFQSSAQLQNVSFS